MSQISLKTAGRLAGLLLMVVAALEPWFVDTHPATEETCLPPLVWVGEGYCACLVSLAASLGQAANLGNSKSLFLTGPAKQQLAAIESARSLNNKLTRALISNIGHHSSISSHTLNGGVTCSLP